MTLAGKTAVVTGGSRGIGREICLELARRGAGVVFSYAGNESAAKETLSLLEETGVPAVCVRADASDPAGAKALTDAALSLSGRIDILVNNAGITRDGLLLRMSEEAFAAVIDTNLKGAFLMIKAVYRTMMRQKYGRIISISSVVGLHGNAGQANYAASKAGLIGLTRSAAKELAARGVTVNAVAPGLIDTDMTAVLPGAAKDAILSSIPAARAGTPADVAKAVAFLAGDDAAYITGQVLAVDGGMSM